MIDCTKNFQSFHPPSEGAAADAQSLSRLFPVLPAMLKNGLDPFRLFLILS